MQDLKFLNSKARKDFTERLEKLYGFRGHLPGHLLVGGKEKVYLLEDSEILRSGQDKELRIDRAGLKIATFTSGDGVRMNIEGSQIIGPQCSKHILEIDHGHFERLVKGEDFVLSESELFQTKNDNGLFILKHRSDFLGSGIVKEGKLHNCLSKIRRVKNLNN